MARAQALVVLVTVPTLREAKQLARLVVEQRVAACVNVIPGVASLFWWKGRVDQAKETLLIIKTTAKAFDALRRLVCAHHPYDVPEVIALPIQTGHRPYLTWVQESVRQMRRRH